MEIFYYLHDTPGAYAIAAVATFGYDGGASLLAKALAAVPEGPRCTVWHQLVPVSM